MSQASEQIASQFSSAAGNRRSWYNITYNVKDPAYGAVGDGVTNDTAAIQSAIDAAILVNGIVWFPPGTYMVTSLNIQHGITLEGYGAILKRPANQPNFTRTMTTENKLYTGASDSAPLTIRGLTFDGNRANQGAYTNFELEQSHLIFLTGNPAVAGKVNAIVEDCHFYDGVADAISVYQNMSCKISNCTMRDVFRGGVTITGGYTDVQINNVKAYGSVHASGIDIEIDGAGYGGSLKVNITADGLFLPDGDFDVSIVSGSTFTGNNIQSLKAPFFVSAEDSTVKISNSVFYIGKVDAVTNRILAPNDVTFQNCTFYATETGAESTNSIACIHVVPFGKTNQTLKLLDCEFRVDGTVETVDTVYAVYCESDLLANNNRVIIQGGTISTGFDYGVYIVQGGTYDIRNMLIQATTAIYWGATSGGYDNTITIDGVVPKGHTTYMRIATHSPAQTVTHKNMILTEAENTLATDFGLSTNTYRGNRVILGATSPVARSVPGLLGDIFRLTTPTAGAVYEWVCTVSSETAATWKTKTTLGA